MKARRKFHFTFFLLFFLLLSETNGQPSFVFGPEIENDSRYQAPVLVGKIDGDLFVIHFSVKLFRTSNFFLERYNSKFQQIKQVELSLKYLGQDLVFEKAEVFGKCLYIFTSYLNDSKKKNFLLLQEYDINSLTPKGEPRVIMEYPIIKTKEPGSFQFSSSSNGQIRLIFAELPSEKEIEQKFQACVLSSSAELLWENKFSLPVKGRLFEIRNQVIDNNGNFFLCGRLFNEKVRIKRYGEPNYEYVVYSWMSGGIEKTEYHLSFPDKFITDFVLGVSQEGDLTGAGFWSDRGVSSIKGCFFVKIDSETRGIKSKNFKEFSIDFLEQFMSEKKVAKGEELYEYDLRNLVFRPDGGVYLLAEQFYIHEYSTTSYGRNGEMRTHTTYIYYYNHIIVVSFGQEGEILWTTKIPKYQVTSNDGGYFSSYALGVNNDKLFLVFNDHPDNLQIKDKSNLKNYMGKESVTDLCTVFPDGEFKKEILFDNKEEQVYSRPKVMQQFLPGDDFFVYGERKKTYKFGAIRFN